MDFYSNRRYEDRSKEDDFSREPGTGEFRTFIKPKEFKEYENKKTINDAKKDIERYEKKIEELQADIYKKRKRIEKVSKELESSSNYTFGKYFSASPYMFPLALHIIFTTLEWYDLVKQKSNLGVLYNTVYQSVVTSMVSGFILLLIVMFISSNLLFLEKNVKIGTLIISSGISIVLCASVVDKIGKTYRMTDGRTVSPSDYVSSKWIYWNMIVQIFVILGTIYFHEYFDKNEINSSSRSDSRSGSSGSSGSDSRSDIRSGSNRS